MKKLLMTAMTAALVAMTWMVATSAQGQPSTEPSASDKVRITGWALNMSNIATGSNPTADITLDRWSTAEERENFIVTMVEQGPDALLKALQTRLSIISVMVGMVTEAFLLSSLMLQSTSSLKAAMVLNCEILKSKPDILPLSFMTRLKNSVKMFRQFRNWSPNSSISFTLIFSLGFSLVLFLAARV